MNAENLKEITAIYAEDEPITRMMFSKLFRNTFKKLFVAENGKEAIDFYKENKIDIIITDLAMPVMSGFEFIRQVREDNNNIFILVTTAYQEEANIIKHAVNAVLNKPVSKPDVIQTILDCF